MRSVVTIVLFLAPSVYTPGALLFEPETCCAAADYAADADSLNTQGSDLYAAGAYTKAEEVLREALRRSQQDAAPNGETVAGILFNLAAVARVQSRLEEAEALYKRSISLRESVSGPDSPQLGRSFSGLALVYMSGGRLKEAIAIARRAVEVSTNGDVHQMAVASNTLATLLLADNDAAQAAALEEHITAELNRNGASATTEYVNGLTNLGTAHMRQGKYGQAELDFRQAEVAAIKMVGTNHPMTATIWNNLAKVRLSQGDSREAGKLFEKAIASWRQALGPAHPDLAQGISNLAAIYAGRKQYKEAERLYRQALEIDESALGSDSLKVANDWNNLGALSSLQHHRKDAESRLSKAFWIAERKVGLEHPDTAAIAVNLAVVYLSQARYEEASELFATALPVRERVLGSDSMELAAILRLYAASLKANRNYVAGEKAELRATRITTRNAL
jgi:tetratricopeptide (TPR) repeat protein